MNRTRLFFGIIFGLLALNVAIGVYVYTTRASEATDAAIVAQETGTVQPLATPIIGRDVPPPNPLREGGPALPIMRLLPVGMLVLIIVLGLWVRSRRRAEPDAEQTP